MPTGSIPWERYLETIRGVGSIVPTDALMGYHLCYGDLGGRHIVQPQDLSLLTRMANAAVVDSGRPVDWIHMPVPIDRADDAYFAPLRDLNAPESRLFLGLIHPLDGLDGAKRRIQTARSHSPTSLGFSTECGFGRRPADSVLPLLKLHREIAES